MKLNPCILCGKQPTVDTWADKGYAAYCYKDVDTHALNCYGKTKEAAVARWNRLNPTRHQGIVRRILNILGLGARYGR
jgi:hypothetical protein